MYVGLIHFIIMVVIATLVLFAIMGLVAWIMATPATWPWVAAVVIGICWVIKRLI